MNGSIFVDFKVTLVVTQFLLALRSDRESSSKYNN